MSVQSGEGLLSAHLREEIDHWLERFPPDRRRSAVLAALRAAGLDEGVLTRGPDFVDAVKAFTQGQGVQVALETFRRHRDRAAFDDLVGPAPGVLTTDRFPVYTHLGGRRRQVCWAQPEVWRRQGAPRLPPGPERRMAGPRQAPVSLPPAWPEAAEY